jgi:uncharacterized membrane protein YagU involved in acid resistance
MNKLGSLFIHGALAGGIAAASMTVLRMLAHRRGWIQAMVPQAMEVWAKEKTPLLRHRSAATHHVADQLLHLGYGALAGGTYAVATPKKHAALAHGLELGTGLWAFASMVLFPALGIARPLWRATPREELVNWSAHALYGAVTVYLLDEFERQKHTQPRSRLQMRHSRVG